MQRTLRAGLNGCLIVSLLATGGCDTETRLRAIEQSLRERIVALRRPERPRATVASPVAAYPTLTVPTFTRMPRAEDNGAPLALAGADETVEETPTDDSANGAGGKAEATTGLQDVALRTALIGRWRLHSSRSTEGGGRVVETCDLTITAESATERCSTIRVFGAREPAPSCQTGRLHTRITESPYVVAAIGEEIDFIPGEGRIVRDNGCEPVAANHTRMRGRLDRLRRQVHVTIGNDGAEPSRATYTRVL